MTSDEILFNYQLELVWDFSPQIKLNRITTTVLNLHLGPLISVRARNDEIGENSLTGMGTSLINVKLSFR